MNKRTMMIVLAACATLLPLGSTATAQHSHGDDGGRDVFRTRAFVGSHDFHHHGGHGRHDFGFDYGWGGWGGWWGPGYADDNGDYTPSLYYQHEAEAPGRVSADQSNVDYRPPPCPLLLRWSPKLGRAVRINVCD